MIMNDKINFTVPAEMKTEFENIAKSISPDFTMSIMLRNLVAYVLMMDNENLERTAFLGRCAQKYTEYEWKKRGEICNELGLKWPVFEQVK